MNWSLLVNYRCLGIQLLTKKYLVNMESFLMLVLLFISVVLFSLTSQHFKNKQPKVHGKTIYESYCCKIIYSYRCYKAPSQRHKWKTKCTTKTQSDIDTVTESSAYIETLKYLNMSIVNTGETIGHTGLLFCLHCTWETFIKTCYMFLTFVVNSFAEYKEKYL